MMDLRYIPLIDERREDLWESHLDVSKLFGQAGVTLGSSPSSGPRDLIGYIKERKGETIVASDPSAERILGWICVFPDRDEGGLFYHLAGIEVHADFRRRGIGAGLMDAARLYIEKKKTQRLKFGTSPLLTHCAGLYVTRFGTRYYWKQGVKMSDGRPWPYVSCECDFEDSLFKPLDLRDDEVEARNVLDWEGSRPIPRKAVAYSGPLAVAMADSSAAGLAKAVDSIPDFLPIVYRTFDTLFRRGYGFAWFDRAVIGGESRPYYLMKKLLTM
jgi:ribosomal protein S18 acetylase RimI-like enzyme